MDNNKSIALISVVLGAGYLLFGNSNSTSTKEKIITLPNGQKVPESRMPELGYVLINSGQESFWVNRIRLQEFYLQQNQGNSSQGGFVNWLNNNGSSILNQIKDIIDQPVDPLSTIEF